MGALAPPPRSAAPMTAVTYFPFTWTLASTGDGGSPPAAKSSERTPPQVPATLMAPDALSRLSQYPRASPKFAAQVFAGGKNGRLVLNVTIPPAITAEVTVCSPGFAVAGASTPPRRSTYHPVFVLLGRTPAVVQLVGAVKSCIVDAVSRLMA